MPKLLSKDNKVGLSYFGLIIVILVWGSAPLVATEINKAFSPSISMTIRGFLVAVFLFLISIKKLKLLNKRYFIVALSTGLFYAVASILQRFGLKSTTPSHYQFLENLSCLVVPFLMWWFIKKKPNVLTILSCILCLVSALILCGFDFTAESLKFGTGDILCALAGVLYGFNIAGTGAFSKDLDPFLYVMLQQVMLFVCGLFSILIEGVSGASLQYDFSLLNVSVLIIEAICISALCWIIRTYSMKYVDATVVSVIMPLTAVVTVLLSALLGKENLTLSLIIGGSLGLVATYLSVLGDKLSKKKENK